MYCSHCGYELKKQVITRTLINDEKRTKDINYLAKLLKSFEKQSVKAELNELKENKASKDEISSRKEVLDKELNSKLEIIQTKLNENDLLYFQNELGISYYRDENTVDNFVCPRCHHEVKHNLDEDDVKSLARASHSEIHRGRNNISGGLCSLMIGLILFIIGLMFFALSFKATAGGVLVTTCVEFYVFIVLVVLGLSLIIGGLTNFVLGRLKVKRYELLLKDIQNGVFHQ